MCVRVVSSYVFTACVIGLMSCVIGFANIVIGFARVSIGVYSFLFICVCNRVVGVCIAVYQLLWCSYM